MKGSCSCIEAAWTEQGWIKYVLQKYEDQEIQVVFSVVAQPFQTNGELWYNCASLFEVYKPQFFFYFSNS